MKRMFFSVLMMLFVAFAYAEGTPASTKLPVEKISAKKFSEALKNEQIPSNASVKEIKTELKQAEVTQEQIGDPVVVIILIPVTIEIYDAETGEFFTLQAYLIVVIIL